MKEFKCRICKKEWFVDDSLIDSVVACPFCLYKVPAKREINVDSFETAVLKVIVDYGVEIVSDRRKFLSYLTDIGYNYRKEIKILSNACDSKTFSNFFDITKCDLIVGKDKIKKIHNRLIDDEGIAEQWATIICDAFYKALNYNKIHSDDTGITQNLNIVKTEVLSNNIIDQEIVVNDTVQDSEIEIPDDISEAADELIFQHYLVDLFKINGIAVGNIVSFGNYKWKIIEINKNGTLMICQDFKENHPFNREWKSITWNQCSLRKWLNDEYLRSNFSLEEIKYIMNSKNFTKVDDELFPGVSEETLDKVFIFDLNQYDNYKHLIDENESQWMLRTTSPIYGNEYKFVITCEKNELFNWGVRVDYPIMIKPVLRISNNYFIDKLKVYD